jgi:hypothetical protein
MPLLLRKINLDKWNPDEAVKAWLPPDDIEGDPMGDLQTEDNALSFYEIGDDKANVNQVIAALAAKVKNPGEIGYALVEQKTLSDLGCDIEERKGTTPDDTVNNWHRDVVKVSCKRLYRLIEAIRNDSEIDVFFESDVEDALRVSLTAGNLDVKRVNIGGDLRKRLGLPANCSLLNIGLGCTGRLLECPQLRRLSFGI